jgi:hypothetical protein
VDDDGHSGGLITGFSSNCVLINYFSISSGIFTELFCKELDKTIYLLNLYGSYEGREVFWENGFSLNCSGPIV